MTTDSSRPTPFCATDNRLCRSESYHVAETIDQDNREALRAKGIRMSMNMTTRIVRIVALPVVAAGIAGAAVLGLAGTASAASDAQPQPVLVATPHTKAQPALGATPGNWWHRHHPSLLDPATAANFTAPGA
jgi:hypothetical protein